MCLIYVLAHDLLILLIEVLILSILHIILVIGIQVSYLTLCLKHVILVQLLEFVQYTQCCISLHDFRLDRYDYLLLRL